jgi:hypothetical protein
MFQIILRNEIMVNLYKNKNKSTICVRLSATTAAYGDIRAITCSQVEQNCWGIRPLPSKTERSSHTKNPSCLRTCRLAELQRNGTTSLYFIFRFGTLAGPLHFLYACSTMMFCVSCSTGNLLQLISCVLILYLCELVFY